MNESGKAEHVDRGRRSPAMLNFVGVFFFALGIRLALRPAQYTHSACWGHLGCNYFIRVSSSVNWLGIVCILLGVVIFYKTVTLSGNLKRSRGLIIIAILLLFSAWNYFVRLLWFSAMRKAILNAPVAPLFKAGRFIERCIEDFVVRKAAQKNRIICFGNDNEFFASGPIRI